MLAHLEDAQRQQVAQRLPAMTGSEAGEAGFGASGVERRALPTHGLVGVVDGFKSCSLVNGSIHGSMDKAIWNVLKSFVLFGGMSQLLLPQKVFCSQPFG